jgi:hypothetical protein
MPNQTTHNEATTTPAVDPEALTALLSETALLVRTHDATRGDALSETVAIVVYVAQGINHLRRDGDRRSLVGLPAAEKNALIAQILTDVYEDAAASIVGDLLTVDFPEPEEQL